MKASCDSKCLNKKNDPAWQAPEECTRERIEEAQACMGNAATLWMVFLFLMALGVSVRMVASFLRKQAKKKKRKKL